MYSKKIAAARELSNKKARVCDKLEWRIIDSEKELEDKKILIEEIKQRKISIEQDINKLQVELKTLKRKQKVFEFTMGLLTGIAVLFLIEVICK